MAYMFNKWPTVSYDLKKNGKPLQLTNITLRFKLNELLLDKVAVMYQYDVQDGERADIIAEKYYGDGQLDWVIYLINNIIDPQFDWPLDDRSFDRYIRNKYGSRESAKQTHHAYEKILRGEQILFDGTVIDQKTVIVDKESYDLTAPSSRRAIDKYTYELELNEANKRINILDRKYLPALISTYEAVIEQV